MCIGLEKIVFYISLNNICKKFRFVEEEKLQAVNGEAFLQHLSILYIIEEEKGAIIKEIEVIHKLCCLDLVGLIQNYRKNSVFPL